MFHYIGNSRASRAYHHSTQQTVYTPHTRKRVADTDVGKTLLERIEDLQRLLVAYRSGAIKEHSR